MRLTVVLCVSCLALAASPKGWCQTMARDVTRDRILPRADCFFGLHFDLHPGATDTILGRYVDAANIRTLLERVNPDYVQYDCKGHAGYTGYPAAIGWPSPGIVKDSLAVWREVTRERNTGLYIHYSGVWDAVAIEHHPEWAVVHADGSRDAMANSVFGPYVDELLIPQVKEVIDKYAIDGIWADGECWGARLDWCEEAQRQFTEETGVTEIPTSREDSHWLEWKDFHRRAFERYLCHWVDALHAYRPGFQITSNWMYTPHAPKPIVADLDYLSGDYSPTLSVDRARVEARYLASNGRPWDLMAWGFNWIEGTGHCLKTPEHLQQEAAVVLMQGGGFQIYNQPTRGGRIPSRMIEDLGQVADFCRARQAVSHKSTTVPQVALLLSNAAWADRCDSVFVPAGIERLEGALHALLELHYSVDILAEHQLEPRLAEYPVVVIPECHRLPDGFRAKLVDYVRGGGQLLLLGGEPARLFGSEIGVTFGEPHHGAAELAVGDGFVSVRGPWERVTLAGAEGLAHWHPDRLLREEDAQWAATRTRLGEGAIVAVYGEVATTNYHSHHPAIRLFIGELMAELLTDPIVRVEGPPTVEVAVRRTRDGRLAVHLLNTSGMPLGNRTVTDYIPEVRDLTLTIRLDAPPTRVTLEPGGVDLTPVWDPAAGACTVTISTLAIHEVVALH